MSIYECLKDSNLRRILQGIEDYVQREFLRFWQLHAPHFTDHGVDHCRNIISILDRMIPSNVMEDMDNYEIFLLLCGVWLHDIGMLVKLDKETPENVREFHHEKGRRYIRERFAEINLSDDDKYVIGEMAFYHRNSEDISYAKEIMELQHNSTVSRVRVRFLCALLRLADACEIAHSRSSRELVEMGGLDDEAKFHHEAHLHVSSVTFDPITQQITLHLRVKNDKDKVLLTNFFKSNLEKELLSVKNVLEENEVIYSSVECDVIIDSYATEVSGYPPQTEERPLGQKLAEFENRTGYVPSMLIEKDNEVHIFYETVSQTTKELQQEIISVLEHVHDLFEGKDVILTISRIHDYRGTVGKLDPEIVTVSSKSDKLRDYRKRKLDQRSLWKKLGFFVTRSIDQFNKRRIAYKWSLVI